VLGAPARRTAACLSGQKLLLDVELKTKTEPWFAGKTQIAISVTIF
jgi:hypothetical protein